MAAADSLRCCIDPRLLALSFASALALLVCFSWLEVSQVTLKTTKHEA